MTWQMRRGYVPLRTVLRARGSDVLEEEAIKLSARRGYTPR